jgi:hypothetical protein
MIFVFRGLQVGRGAGTTPFKQPATTGTAMAAAPPAHLPYTQLPHNTHPLNVWPLGVRGAGLWLVVARFCEILRLLPTRKQ